MAIFLLAINGKISLASVSLDCTFSISIPGFVAEIYLCSGKPSFDGQNSEKLTAVNGTHLPGKGNEDVQGLRVTNRGLTFIPVNVEEFFQNLLYLDLSLNYITYVSNNHLIPFPNLMRVNLNSNKIAQLESNLFNGLESIRYIDFIDNKIKHIGHDFILPDSGEIYFNSNPCIDRGAITPDQIASLRHSLLVNCPPSISQIEVTLESRPNLITKMNRQVQSLDMRTDCLEQSSAGIDIKIEILTNKVTDISCGVDGLVTRTDSLEKSQSEMNGELEILMNRLPYVGGQVQSLVIRTDSLDQGFSQMKDKINVLTNQLTNAKNGFQQLERRVAILESFIKNKLGFTMNEVYNDNKNYNYNKD